MSRKNRSASITAAPPRGVSRPPVMDNGKPAAAPKAAPKSVNPAVRVFHAIASLKVTVGLLAGAMLIVLWGTLAQVDFGIDIVVPNYFRSFLAWIPLKIIFLRQIDSEFLVPFPGGWAWGAAMLLNLAAAHALRFKLSIKKVGIWMIHSGLIVLMLGELVTGLASVESRMVIEEGRTTSFLQDHRLCELAFVDASDSATDHTVVVPERLLHQAGRTIINPGLPANVKVVEFMANSSLLERIPDGIQNRATRGAGLRDVVQKEKVVSGVDKEGEGDVPSVYFELLDKTSGESLGVWLASEHLKDQRVEIAGKTYEMSLRPKRTYLPYSFHLSKFTHDVYEGTDKPKDFRSYVHISEPASNTERDTEIYMNTPLRFRGKTFFQGGFLPPRLGRGTVLQVVDNPGRLLPYVACSLVSLGMLVHFGIHLARFFRTQRMNAVQSA